MSSQPEPPRVPTGPCCVKCGGGVRSAPARSGGVSGKSVSFCRIRQKILATLRPPGARAIGLLLIIRRYHSLRYRWPMTTSVCLLAFITNSSS